MSQNCQNRKHRKTANTAKLLILQSHIVCFTNPYHSPPQVNSYCNIITLCFALYNFSLLPAFYTSFVLSCDPISLCLALYCIPLHYCIFFTLPLPFALFVLLHPFYVAKFIPVMYPVPVSVF